LLLLEWRSLTSSPTGERVRPPPVLHGAAVGPAAGRGAHQAGDDHHAAPRLPAPPDGQRGRRAAAARQGQRPRLHVQQRLAHRVPGGAYLQARQHGGHGAGDVHVLLQPESPPGGQEREYSVNT